MIRPKYLCENKLIYILSTQVYSLKDVHKIYTPYGPNIEKQTPEAISGIHISDLAALAS